MSRAALPELIEQVLSGARRAACWRPRRDDDRPSAIYSGSFAPRHDGHRALAAHAGQRLQLAVAHEISLSNVDKPPLTLQEAVRRAAQFKRDEPLWLTAAPRFIEKAELFAGASFLVGIDTLTRIAERRYYASDAERERALETLRSRGCRFVVYGRRQNDGSFGTLRSAALPAALAALCVEVPESEFRSDLRSRDLRSGFDA